jgi:hypothetical protein
MRDNLHMLDRLAFAANGLTLRKRLLISLLLLAPVRQEQAASTVMLDAVGGVRPGPPVRPSHRAV